VARPPRSYERLLRSVPSIVVVSRRLSALAQDADALQPLTDRSTFLSVLLRQPQARSAVCYAQLEGVNYARVIEPARGQVGLR
jgi:hypothetical protein